MVNLRTYTIKSKEVISGCIRFELDGHLTFFNGADKDYILCDNISPYNTWEVDSQIEIDLDVVKYRDYRDKINRNDVTGVITRLAALGIRKAVVATERFIENPEVQHQARHVGEHLYMHAASHARDHTMRAAQQVCNIS